MTDIVLNNITSGYNIAKVNDNFQKIEDSINNDLVNRSGGNNTMVQDLDMNSNNLLNVETLNAESIKLNGLTLAPETVVVTDAVLASDLASTAAGKGASLVGFEQVGPGAVARTMQAKAQERVSILDFGAVGDGVTDDSAAYLKLLTYICTRYGSSSLYAGAMYFPGGYTFLITTNNFIGQLDFTTLPGGTGARYYLSHVGDGLNSNIIWRPTGTTDLWMYDNGSTSSANNVLVFPQFDGLQIQVDVTNITGAGTFNGFREFGAPGVSGATQGFQFNNVRIVGVNYPGTTTDIAKAGTLFSLLGTANASETVMNNCFVRGFKNLMVVGPNAEAVNHAFINTNAEVMYGDVFVIQGGSNINVHGGSWSMFSQDASWFANFTVTTAGYFGTFTFSSARLEQDFGTIDPTICHAGILKIDATAQASANYPPSFKAKVNFDSFNFSPSVGLVPNSIMVDAATQMTVNFRGCAFSNVSPQGMNLFSSIAGLSTIAAVGQATAVNFMDGDAVTPSAMVFASSDAIVNVASRNCTNTLDYNVSVGLHAGRAGGRNIPLKTAQIWGSTWPYAGQTSYMFTKLPLNSLLRSVRFYKSAGGSSTTSYQIHATDANGVVTYCQSTVGAQNIVHSAYADNLNVLCNTTAKQSVYLLTTSGNGGSAVVTPMAPGDYALVDYY